MIASYIIFITCLLSPFLLHILFYKNNIRVRTTLNLLGYFPTFFFAALRENSGTDTPMYREIFSSRVGENFIDAISSIDPAYYAIQWIFNLLNLDVQYFFAFQAFTVYISFCFAQPHIDKSIPIFGLILLPVLMIDATFNGLRYGLSFACISIITAYYKNNMKEMKLILLAPASFHSSALLFALQRKIAWAFIPLAILLAYLTLQDLYIYDYIFNKFSEYSDIPRGAWFSGFFPILQLASIMYIRNINECNKSPLYRTSIFLATLSICLSSISMASLRFMQISIFFAVIATSIDIQKSRSNNTMFALSIIGLLSILNFLRQIFYVGAAGDVLFAPYEFSKIIK